MHPLDVAICCAYLSIPAVTLWFRQRFKNLLLIHLREELGWMVILTFTAGLDHFLHALRILPADKNIKVGMAVVLWFTAWKMIQTKRRMAQELFKVEKESLRMGIDLTCAQIGMKEARQDLSVSRNETKAAIKEVEQTKVSSEESKKDFMAYLLHVCAACTPASFLDLLRVCRLPNVTVAQEMRNPMQSIVAMADALSATSLTTVQSEALNSILIAVTLMKRLTADLLDFRKMEAGKMGFESISFDLMQSLLSITQTFRQIGRTRRLSTGTATAAATQTPKVTFEEYLDPSLPKVVIGDPTRLHQIIMNLLSNAFKFTKEGKITIRVYAEQNTTALGKPVSGDEKKANKEFIWLRIDVSDTGIGMTGEEVAKVFLPFAQAKLSTYRQFGGTGLGLAITKQLVENLQGTVTVTSEPGRGSKFTVRFPLQLASEQAEALKSATITHGIAPMVDKQKTQKHTILLVDDNLIIRKLIGNMLANQLGFVLQTASDGREAVNKVMSEPTKFSLIFMDISMPVCDGYQATREIRALKFSRPIVALTAHAGVEELTSIKSSGMNDALWKPVCTSELVAMILHHMPELMLEGV